MPRPGFPGDHEIPALGDKLRPQVRAELLPPDRGLEHEVELLDRLEEGEVGGPRELLDARVGPVRDLLGEQQREEVPMGPSLLGRAGLVVGEEARDGREVQPAHDRGEVDVGEVHHATSASAAAMSSTV